MQQDRYELPLTTESDLAASAYRAGIDCILSAWTGASEALDQAIAADPDAAEKVRSGKVAAAGALVGAVMKATKGQADATTVRRLVLEQLGG